MRLFDFQCLVNRWAMKCFSTEYVTDKTERGFRFLEEALELAQAAGVTRSQAFELLNYTYNRPSGIVRQEVGGVLTTLGIFCTVHDISLEMAAREELDRICEPDMMDRIRQKQAAKPHGSPLPGVYPHDMETSKIVGDPANAGGSAVAQTKQGK